ncbi:hypothetical protein [Pseudomonas aeruginosa]|uniref:hypothetical protein n=1 Tax=Pseudomonas aeruginosa TaxID=287 RepID=UPI000EB47719|nr:hypothetical protein [Pseudomonas aeruginosa]RUG07290.1 hypothetical protein IPC824_27200 [Pseudomonas aeruginosa]
MNKANECTCPSGDGSLVHPCPAHPAVEQADVAAKLTFINGRPAMCGCQVEYSDGGGEYSDVIYVTLCAKHSGSAILDLVATNRIALTPEYEGQWHADLYLDREIPLAKVEGATPAEAVLALMSAERIDPEQESVEQAGGDERDFQAKGAQEVPSPVSKEYDRHLIGLLRKGEALPGHQEEAADEIERLHDWNDHLNNTVLPNILNPNFLMLMKGGERLLDLCTKDGKFIGVSLNDMKDVFDWMVTHARIAPDHAALPQPSPASDLDPFNLAPHAEAFNEAPAEALKSDQAEVERPDVVAVVRAQGFGRVCEADANALYQHCSDGETLMTVAQHERIVGELRAVIAQLRQHKNDYMDAGQETYRALQNEIREREAEIARLDGLVSGRTAERDAALARVAELERGKVYVEARQCDECQHGGINDSATGVAACHECDWTGPEPEEDRCPGCQRENCMAAACPQCGARYVLVASEEIAAPVAQAQQLNDLDKQCRDDVARALGLRPSQERGFAWSYLLASIKSCVEASEDAAQAQHSVPEGWMLVECGIWTQEQVDEMQKTVARFRNSEFVDDRALAMAVADAGQCKAPEISLAELLAAEAQALRDERDSQQRVAIKAMEELAALHARVVVVPERDARRMDTEYPEGWNDCLDELARLNGKTVSEGLLRGMGAFAQEIISGALEGGKFDGADLQESAERHGLIAKQVMNEPCRGPEEYCACAWSTSFPTECYRITAELRALLNKDKENGNG